MTAPRGHVQVPRSLLYSERHGGPAVWAWAMYETLMPHGLGGGRAQAVARRRYVAERAGTSTGALDDARRELLAAAPGGPYLSRSTPRGAKRSVKHAALRLPRETGEPFSPVPSWTLNLVWAGRRRPSGRVSPDVWRLYAACVDRACRTADPRAFDATVGRLGAALHASPDTGRRRLAELEAAGLVEVTERSGGRLSIRVVLDAAEAAEIYASEGRRRVEPRRDPSRIAALTPARTGTHLLQIPALHKSHHLQRHQPRSHRIFPSVTRRPAVPRGRTRRPRPGSPRCPANDGGRHAGLSRSTGRCRWS